MAEDRNIFHEFPAKHLRVHTSTNQVKNWITMILPIVQKLKKYFKNNLLRSQFQTIFFNLARKKDEE